MAQPQPRPRTLSSFLSEPANSYIRRPQPPSVVPNTTKALPATPTPTLRFHRRGSCAEGVGEADPLPPTPSSSSSSGLDCEDGHVPAPASSRSSSRVRIPRSSRTPSPARWDQDAFSLSLSFTGNLSSPSSSSASDSAPPAFFPQQRVGFSPRLKVRSSKGLPLSLIGGMTLGVTGCVSVPLLDRSTGRQVVDPTTGEPRWKSKRVHVDFVTDLTPGLEIWKADAEAAAGRGAREVLPMGTYVLPLSMRIPASEKLPPSFSCPYFTISYSMSVAIWSATTNPATGLPTNTKIYSAPFEVLPSTLPTGPPQAPRIVWEAGGRYWAAAVAGEAIGGVWEGLKKVVTMGSAVSSRPSLRRSSRSSDSVSLLSPTPSSPPLGTVQRSASSRTIRKQPSLLGFKAPTEVGWSHVVTPSLPSSTFSPSSHASIPLQLTIVSRPVGSTAGPKTDIYVRVALVRTLYVRDRGCDVGSEAADTMLPEELVLANYVKEEKEVCSRWAYFLADELESDVVTREVGLPLFNPDGTSWHHGYSSAIALAPELPPPKDAFPAGPDGTASSWFSPTLRQRPPVEKEYARFLYAESKFSVVVEVGFSTRSADDDREGAIIRALAQLHEAGQTEIPLPGVFSEPATAGDSEASRPFATPSSPALTAQRPATTTGAGFVRSPERPAFRGRIKVTKIPVTIGSVAEPMLECLSVPSPAFPPNTPPASPASRMGSSPSLGTTAWSRSERQNDESDSEDGRSIASSAPSSAAMGRERSHGSLDDGDGRYGDAEAWIVPPPDYDSALGFAPAYV